MADPDLKTTMSISKADETNEKDVSAVGKPVTPDVDPSTESTVPTNIPPSSPIQGVVGDGCVNSKEEANPQATPSPATPLVGAEDNVNPVTTTGPAVTSTEAAKTTATTTLSTEDNADPGNAETTTTQVITPLAEDSGGGVENDAEKRPEPPLIIVAAVENNCLDVPVVRVKSDDSTTASSPPPPVARTNSDEAVGRPIISSQESSAATAPASIQNHVRNTSEDDGLDEYIKSPHGQNAIVERSPGGRYVRFMEKLGSGASKDVYRAYDTQEGIEVAWNVVSLSGVPKSERNRIVNEVRLLERLHHHNIISFHGSWVNRERQEVHFVTEILSSGTLKSFINKVQVIRWKIAKRWAVQILKGLEYLHSQDPPVIHRDLKCENIFINGTSGDLRIGDLGLSTVHRNGRVLSVLGTPEFMAPDMYEDTSYDEKVDIYAFGMCMLEIFTKEIPYKECKNPAQIYKKVSNGELPEMLSRLRSRHARDFIMLCLGYKDENGVYVRPTAKELLTHEFLIKRPNDEDEVMVDPPLIKRTIAENEVVSPSTTGWPTGRSQNQTPSQSQPADITVDRGEASTPVKVDSEQGSADGDESDRFEEMPDSEVNIRKVKVLMGRGQELKEDEEPLADSSARSMEGSTHSRASSVDPLPDSSGQVMKNGVTSLKASKKVNNAGPSLQVTQPGHYLVAAAVIESEAAQTYPDDILKLVVTLPVEGQTQNVQFDFHLVEDDPVQVGKEMVAELGIPQGAVLEISETISGLACAARMQRDKHRMRAQQNAQGLMTNQPQHILSQQQMPGGTQDMQQGASMQQGSGMQQQQQQNLGPSEYQGGQTMLQQHPQHLGQPQQQPPQQHLTQPGNQNQASHIPNEAQSQTAPYSHMQNPNHITQQQQMLNQVGQGSHMISDTQSQPAHFGYDPNQNNIPHQPQLQTQGMSQHGNVVPSESQSLPAYGYDGGLNQMQTAEPSSIQPNPAYMYDPGQGPFQNQQQPMQTPNLLPQQSGVADGSNHQNTYLFDGQPQQGQGTQHAGQQGGMPMAQQPNQMAPQQLQQHLTLQNQSQQAQQMPGMHQHHQNSQHQSSGLMHPSPQQNGAQYTHAPLQGTLTPAQDMIPSSSHVGGMNQQQPQHQLQMHQQQQQPQQQHQMHQQQHQMFQQQPQQQQQQPQMLHQQQQPPHQQQQLHQQLPQQQHLPQQQMPSYPSSPLQQQQLDQMNSADGVYEHGVSLPNVSRQMIGVPPDSASLKRSVSTNSHQATTTQQRNVSRLGQLTYQNACAPTIQNLPPTEKRLPPSRTSSGHASTPVKANLSGIPQQMGDESNSSQQMLTREGSQGSESKNGSSLLGDITPIAGSESSEDGDLNEELRKLDEDFQKNLLRAKKVFDNRMDNLQRSQIEREAQHQKTLEKHQKERAEFEKRLQQEEKEQNRRLEQLQREWNQRRAQFSKNKRRVSEDEGTISADVSLSSSPETGHSMPANITADQGPPEQYSLNQTASNDSGNDR